jgi:hypothetical protein
MAGRWARPLGEAPPLPFLLLHHHHPGSPPGRLQEPSPQLGASSPRPDDGPRIRNPHRPASHQNAHAGRPVPRSDPGLRAGSGAGSDLLGSFHGFLLPRRGERESSRSLRQDEVLGHRCGCRDLPDGVQGLHRAGLRGRRECGLLACRRRRMRARSVGVQRAHPHVCHICAPRRCSIRVGEIAKGCWCWCW